MEWLSDKRSSPLEYALSRRHTPKAARAAAAERPFPIAAFHFEGANTGSAAAGFQRQRDAAALGGQGRPRAAAAAEPRGAPRSPPAGEEIPAVPTRPKRCRRLWHAAPRGRLRGLPRSGLSPKRSSPPPRSLAPASRGGGNEAGAPRAFQPGSVIDAGEQPLTINASLPLD